MEAVVESLRSKLKASASGSPNRDTSESRLEFACTHGSGHLLVTGPSRAAVEALLERVIRKTEAIGTIRGNAADPASTVDRLIALLDSENEVTGHLDRRRALLQLLARAQEARKSVFVVVDDADAATVEELERLRMTLEVAPNAIERLRLVLLGDNTLPGKLDAASARALRSRITSRIRVGELESGRSLVSGPVVAVEGGGFSWTFAASAAASFAVVSYATVLLMTAGRASRFEPVAAHDSIDLGSAVAPAAKRSRGLSGDEPYLYSSLRIPADAQWVTGSALFAPPPVVASAVDEAPAVEPAPAPVDVARRRPPEPPPLPKAVERAPPEAASIASLSSLMKQRTVTPSPAPPVEQAAPAPSVVGKRAPQPATSPAPAPPSATSSIAALRMRFR